MCKTLSNGDYVSHVELSQTLGMSITPSIVSAHATRGSFHLVFADDDDHSARVAASFRTAAFFEVTYKCKIPVLVMCNGSALVSILHVFRDSLTAAHPGMEGFCTAVVTELAVMLAKPDKII